MDVIGSMSGIPQGNEIVTSELVGSHDCFLVPIREVQVVIHDGHGKDMRCLISLEHNMLVLAIEIRVSDVIQVSISPPNIVGEVVNCNGVGPS